MIIIKNGRVIDPKTNYDNITDVIIENNRIKKIGQATEDELNEAVQIIDATEKIVTPGFMDVHVHFRDPGFTYKEDIKTGAKAAAAGGYTTVICMANTKPAVDTVETLQYVLEEGKKTKIHVLSAAAITEDLKGEKLTQMEALKKAGAVGFTDDGIPLKDELLVMEAMRKSVELNVPLSFHEENPVFITNNGINADIAKKEFQIPGSPSVAEDTLVARDCMMALFTGAKIDIQHISSKNAVAMVRMAKSLGANVGAEVTPHHFSLTQEAVKEHGTLAKMNPPLRKEEDRMAIIKGLADGTIDMIATDHAPHSIEEKKKPLTEAPSGIIGLETAFGLAITELVNTGYVSIMEVIRALTINPASFYQVDAGYLAENGPADIVIADLSEKWTVKEFQSKASNSPFIGKTLLGRVKYTICNGEVVYKQEK